MASEQEEREEDEPEYVIPLPRYCWRVILGSLSHSMLNARTPPHLKECCRLLLEELTELIPDPHFIRNLKAVIREDPEKGPIQ